MKYCFGCVANRKIGNRQSQRLEDGHFVRDFCPKFQARIAEQVDVVVAL
jgi:hypothetical protein